MLSPARKDIMETREALSIALAALKETSEDRIQARERCKHALSVAMCAATALSKFMQEDDGS